MKILVAYPTRPSFVARDIEILKRDHFVTEHRYFSLSPSNLLNGLRALASCELLFLWFASQRSLPLVLAARMTGKPVITVVGGYEAANCPEINYGNARSALNRLITRWILFHSCKIIAVSASSRGEIIANLRILPDRLTLVHHGFEDNAGANSVRKTKSVLTVGLISNETWLRKGVFEFIKCADQNPEVPFVHVGKVTIDVAAKWGRALPPNLSLKGILSDHGLIQEMSSAMVYLQLSHHEAFGCSVAEAMCLRCIPVVSNRYSLPEVVGDSGFVVDPGDIPAVSKAIGTALTTEQSRGDIARTRILTEFSLEARSRKLLELVKSAKPVNQ